VLFASLFSFLNREDDYIDGDDGEDGEDYVDNEDDLDIGNG
jgi:hypothetical protein